PCRALTMRDGFPSLRVTTPPLGMKAALESLARITKRDALLWFDPYVQNQLPFGSSPMRGFITPLGLVFPAFYWRNTMNFPPVYHLDRQAILDRIHTHFIVNREPAGRLDDSARCVFHGEQGQACAIGIFDDEWDLDDSVN